jgi:hypothetical protein
LKTGRSIAHSEQDGSVSVESGGENGAGLGLSKAQSPRKLLFAFSSRIILRFIREVADQ